MQMIHYRKNMTVTEMLAKLPVKCRNVIKRRLISCFTSPEDFWDNVRSVVTPGGKLTIEDELVFDTMFCACKMREAGCTKEFIAKLFGYNEKTFDAFMKSRFRKVKHEWDTTSGKWCDMVISQEEMTYVSSTWFGEERLGAWHYL